jgi:hypothetical protein
MLTCFCSSSKGADFGTWVLRIDFVHPVTKCRHRWNRSTFSIASLLEEIDVHQGQLDASYGINFSRSLRRRVVGISSPTLSQRDYERWFAFYHPDALVSIRSLES